MSFCLKLIVKIPLIVIFVKKSLSQLFISLVVNPIWKDFILIRPKK